MIIIGIDPGLTGAVAMINTANGICDVQDLPTIELEGGGLVKRRIQGRSLGLQMRQMVPPGHEPIVFLEQVGAMGGQNNAVQTQASLAGTFMGIRCVLDILRWETKLVQPQRWKAKFGLTRKKAEREDDAEKEAAYKGRHLKVARELYPSAPLHLAKHHNRAEALLIAHYGIGEAA